MNKKKTIKKQNIINYWRDWFFGSMFVQHMLDYYDLKKIIIFSRDELKQFQCRKI